MPVLAEPLHLTSRCPDGSTLMHRPLNESGSIPDHTSLFSVCSKGQSSVKILKKTQNLTANICLSSCLILTHDFSIFVFPRCILLKPNVIYSLPFFTLTAYFFCLEFHQVIQEIYYLYISWVHSPISLSLLRNCSFLAIFICVMYFKNTYIRPSAQCWECKKWKTQILPRRVHPREEPAQETGNYSSAL